MREQQSEKSNLESRIFRTKLANSPGSKHRESFIAVLLMAVFLFTSATAQDTNKSKPEPLMIQEHLRSPFTRQPAMVMLCSRSTFPLLPNLWTCPRGRMCKHSESCICLSSPAR